MKIIGIDTGGETGMASFDDGWSDCTQLGPHEHHETLYNQLYNYTSNGETVIVCESYQNDNDFANLVTVEYIGVVKLFADRRKVRLVMQNRNVKTWAMPKLKAAGATLDPHGKNRHASSAQQHILYYICHNPYVDPELRNSMFRRLKEAS